MTLSIIYDVCAILIMVIFYGGYLSTISFMVTGVTTLGLLVLNLADVRRNIKSLLRDFLV